MSHYCVPRLMLDNSYHSYQYESILVCLGDILGREYSVFVNNEEGGQTAGLIKPNSKIFSTLKYFYTFAFFLKDTKTVQNSSEG